MYASLIYYCFRKQKPLRDADKEEGSVLVCVYCCYFLSVKCVNMAQHTVIINIAVLRAAVEL